MRFAGMNHWAILVAAVAGFAFGAIWYTMFSKSWKSALGKTGAELAGMRSATVLFSTAFVAALVMAWVLAGVIGHLGPGQVTVKNGVISAAFIWFGFVATTLIVNYNFQGARPSLMLIDAGHWLGVLLLQGVIIGAFGV